MPVTSKDNQWVKEWRGLCDSAKKRRESGLFAIEGARLCGDALRSGVAIRAVLYTASALAIYTETVGALMAAAGLISRSPRTWTKYLKKDLIADSFLALEDADIP